MFKSFNLLAVLSILLLNPPESLTTDDPIVPSTECLNKLHAESSWGVRTMPLPNYLRHESLGLALGQGQLVTAVSPGSAADIAGLRAGNLIVEVNQQPVMEQASLPILNQPSIVLVWMDSGLKQLQLQPAASDVQVDNLIDPVVRLPEFLSTSLSSDFVLPNYARQGFAGPRSLSVSSVNGQMLVSAIVDTAAGPTQIELRGCQTEVARQLAALPVEVQAQLAPHLGLQ